MEKITQSIENEQNNTKRENESKHTANKRIIFIYTVSKLGENENNSPLKAGGYKDTGDPYRAESVSVSPSPKFFIFQKK